MISFILKLSSFFLVIVCSGTLVACDQVAAGPNVVTPEGQVISVELAITPEEQSKGLMFRENLDENSGMIFIYRSPRQMGFWMKNTLIPLDIVYIDPSGTIVDIQTMEPCPPEEQRCPSYPSAQQAQYALEINAGKAAEWGLEPGDQLTLDLPTDVESK